MTSDQANANDSAEVFTQCSRISKTVPTNTQKLTPHWNSLAKKNPIVHTAVMAIKMYMTLLPSLLIEKILT